MRRLLLQQSKENNPIERKKELLLYCSITSSSHCKRKYSNWLNLYSACTNSSSTPASPYCTVGKRASNKRQFFLQYVPGFIINHSGWNNTLHSSEIRGLCLMKWPIECFNICHILCIQKPKVAFPVFHFVLLYYSPQSLEANLNPSFFFFLLSFFFSKTFCEN